MKKNFLATLFVIVATCIGLISEAKIWRVNSNAIAPYGANMGGTVTYPVFTQLIGTGGAAESNLVQHGDTVYLEGSTVQYTGGSLTKRLVIIGSGYFLNENPNTSNNVLPTTLSHISFSYQSTNSSAGSQLIGVHVISSFGVDINVSNITVKRCKIDATLAVGYNIEDIRIEQNFFARVSTSTCFQGTSFGFPTDVVFNNNIVLATVLINPEYQFLECKNNVFAGPSIASNPSLRFSAASFENNIMTNPAATTFINLGTNVNVRCNTGSSAAQFGTNDGNIVVANMTTLFVASGTSDGKYQLQPGSAAGCNGSERGAFGGPTGTAYSLSGLAPIPVIYQVSTSGVATPAGLDVNIKARTIN